MNRSEAREILMQILFQMEAQKDYRSDLSELFFDKNLKDSNQREYLEKALFFLTENLQSIDKLIDSCSENWKIDRIGKVDLAVIRISVMEILYMDDIPDSVSINEAVDIAKKYGTEDSGKFVNGILGKIVRVKNAE